MSIPGMQGAADGVATVAGENTIAIDVEAFGEMPRHELMGYVAGLVPSAVAVNSDHWMSAQRGVDGVIDRLEAAVAGVAEADFDGSFPDEVRRGHQAFVAAARDFGTALGAPAERLGSAAPQLGALQTQIEAAGGWGAMLAFPAMEQLAPESAELAALMESLYVPALEQASTVPVLPAPSENAAGDAPRRAAEDPSGSADGHAGTALAAARGYAADGAAAARGEGADMPGDAAAPDSSSADAVSDGTLGDGDGVGSTGPGQRSGAGTSSAADGLAADTLAPAGSGGDPGAGIPDSAVDDAGVDAASAGLRGIGSPAVPGGADVPALRPGAGHAVHAPPGSLTSHGPGAYGAGTSGPGAAATGAPLAAPVGAREEGGASIPGRGAGRLAAGAGSSAPSAGTGTGQPGSQSAIGSGRRMPGAGMLGGGRGARQAQGYESAEFLTTVDNGDDLIGDLGRVVQPVLGDGSR